MEEHRHVIGDNLVEQPRVLSPEESAAIQRHANDDDERPCCCCIDAINIFCCIHYLFHIFQPQPMEESRYIPGDNLVDQIRIIGREDFSLEQSELRQLQLAAGWRVLTDVEWRRLHDLRYMLFGDTPSSEEEDALAPEDEAELQLEAREFDRPTNAMFRELALSVSELTAEFREPVLGEARAEFERQQRETALRHEIAEDARRDAMQYAELQEELSLPDSELAQPHRAHSTKQRS